jgi:hypothetical protein
VIDNYIIIIKKGHFLTYVIKDGKLDMKDDSEWLVMVPTRIQKEITILPEIVKLQLKALLHEIRYQGPIRGNWKNYGKLQKNLHHCHIKSGRPTYVSCWRSDPMSKIIEVYYVGTHEKAPY